MFRTNIRNSQTIIRYKGDLTMMNTAETAKRHYETENRESHTEKKKFSNVMAMILGILVTVEIMILGAMVMKIDVHSADRIAMALAFVVYSGVVAALTDK